MEGGKEGEGPDNRELSRCRSRTAEMEEAWRKGGMSWRRSRGGWWTNITQWDKEEMKG